MLRARINMPDLTDIARFTPPPLGPRRGMPMTSHHTPAHWARKNIHPHTMPDPTSKQTFPRYKAEKPHSQQHILCDLQVAPNQLEPRPFPTITTKSPHKSNRKCPITIFSGVTKVGPVESDPTFVLPPVSASCGVRAPLHQPVRTVPQFRLLLRSNRWLPVRACQSS